MGVASDTRDRRTWVVLELTRLGDQKVSEGVFETLIRGILRVEPDYPVFVPSASFKGSGTDVKVKLMVGYAFVASGLTDIEYYRTENTPYVKRVLTERSPLNFPILSVVSDEVVEDLKRQLNHQVMMDVVPGMTVKVLDGKFKTLTGVVTGDFEDMVFIKFTLRSATIIGSVKKSMISPVDEVS